MCSCFQGHDGGWQSGSNQSGLKCSLKFQALLKLSINPISVEKHAEVSQLSRAECFSLLVIDSLDLPPTQSGLESMLEAWRRCCSSESRGWSCWASAAIRVTLGQTCHVRGTLNSCDPVCVRSFTSAPHAAAATESINRSLLRSSPK